MLNYLLWPNLRFILHIYLSSASSIVVGLAVPMCGKHPQHPSFKSLPKIVPAVSPASFLLQALMISSSRDNMRARSKIKDKKRMGPSK